MLTLPPALLSHRISIEMNSALLSLSVSTLFRDFSLEEWTVSQLNQMGYCLADRIVTADPLGQMDQFDADLIFTDHPHFSGDRVVTIPPEAIRWSTQTFIDHLHRTLHRSWQHRNGIDGDVLIIGSAGVLPYCQEIFRTLLNSRLITDSPEAVAIFHEEDHALALMPTRRINEIRRIARLQVASRALFVVGASRAELAGAQSFMEYQRKIHSGLDLGFMFISSREFSSKREVTQAKALLHPFPVFPVSVSGFELARAGSNLAPKASLSRTQIRRLRIKEIANWLGSTRGSEKESHS